MKIKFSHILASATIVLTSLFSFTSFAQDEGRTSNELQDINHQELNINDEDKTLIYEYDSRSGKNTSSETHLNTVIPAKGKTQDSHKPTPTPNSSNTKDGDDALSFNFLFYIIQKYKFTDIIDQ
jgi:hypothetical protein